MDYTTVVVETQSMSGCMMSYFLNDEEKSKLNSKAETASQQSGILVRGNEGTPCTNHSK